MVKRTSSSLLLLICVMILAGCGQKGPLHMPEEREQTQVPAEASELSRSSELHEDSAQSSQ